MEVNTLRTQFDKHEAWAGDRAAEYKSTESMLQQLRLDIHGAKVGGRVALGIALTLGGVVGWLVSLIIAKP